MAATTHGRILRGDESEPLVACDESQSLKTLLDTLRRHLENPTLSREQQALLCFQLAKELEECAVVEFARTDESARTQEKEVDQLWMAQALTTQGTVLARLGQLAPARRSFERAIELARESHEPALAGETTLLLLEEIGECLDLSEMQDFYQQADQYLNSSDNADTLRRLLRAARGVLSATRCRTTGAADVAGAPSLSDSDQVFGKGIRRSEARLIRQALVTAEGRITQAARLLGITHQRLAYLLQTRHQDLSPARNPIKRRRRRNLNSSAVGATG